MPTNGDYSNWDWSNQNQNNWKMKQNNRWVDIQPPFLWNTDKSKHLDDIYKTQDYTYQKGWRLVHANFDGAYPYFILYNVYASLLRSYIYTGSTVNYNGILTVLTPSEKLKESKILNSATTYQYAIDDTRKLDINNISVLDTYAGLGSWSVADFIMTFDSNIKATAFKDQKWGIAFYTTNQMDVKLKITGTSTPVPVDQLTTFVGGTGSITSSGFNTAYSRVNKLVQSGEDYFEKMQKSADKIKPNAWKPLVTYKNTVGKLSKVGNYLSAAASFSSAVGVVASFFDILGGGLGPQSVPMGYVHNLDATGTITFQQKMRDTQFQIPGVEYSYNARPSWAYQCPMGIVNLKKAPVIKKTSSYIKIKDPNCNFTETKIGFQTLYRSCKSTVFSQILVYKKIHTMGRKGADKSKLVKYSLEQGVDLLQQQISGVNIKDIKAAIVCKPNNGIGNNYSYSISSNKLKITSLEKYERKNSWGSSLTPQVYVDIENPVYKYLESGKFIVHKYGENDNDVYFGTPYTDINSLKKIVFEVPENTDVLLGLLVTYYAPNTTEPQIYKALYRFKEVEEKASKPEIFFDEVQPNFGSSEGTLLKSTVSSVDFKCNTSKVSSRSLIVQEPGVGEFSINVYPNPSNGIFNINNTNASLSYDINIYDMSGKLVLSKKNIDSSTSIDMTEYSRGTYVLVATSAAGSYQSKILLK